MRYLSVVNNYQYLEEGPMLDKIKKYAMGLGIAIGILGSLGNSAKANPQLNTDSCGYNQSMERYECALQDGRLLYVGKYDRNGREVPIELVKREMQRLYGEVVNNDLMNNNRQLSSWEMDQLRAMQYQRSMQNQSRDYQREMLNRQYNDHLMNTFVNVGLQFLSRRR